MSKNIEMNYKIDSGYEVIYPNTTAENIQAGRFEGQFTFNIPPLSNTQGTNYNSLTTYGQLINYVALEIESVRQGIGRFGLIGSYVVQGWQYVGSNLQNYPIILVTSPVFLREQARLYNSNKSQYLDFSSNSYSNGFIIFNGTNSCLAIWGCGKNYPSVDIGQFKVSTIYMGVSEGGETATVSLYGMGSYQ